MKIEVSAEIVENALVKKIETVSGQNLLSCYQCGKCSAGCPGSTEMDILPHQIIRLLQLGQLDEVLSCTTIWYCASCFTCAVRCPKGIDLAKIMEASRALVLRSRKGQDRTRIAEIPEGKLDRLPQIALISVLRKST